MMGETNREVALRFVRNISVLFDLYERHQSSKFSAKDYLRAAIMVRHYFIIKSTKDIVLFYGLYSESLGDFVDALNMEEKLKTQRALHFPELDQLIKGLMAR